MKNHFNKEFKEFLTWVEMPNDKGLELKLRELRRSQ